MVISARASIVFAHPVVCNGSQGRAQGSPLLLGVVSSLPQYQHIYHSPAIRVRHATCRADNDDYAATGMGRRTDHAVTRVWLDLEESSAQIVNIRYEFRPQLVRLGVLPRVPEADPLTRREGARGFDDFAPVPRGHR